MTTAIATIMPLQPGLQDLADSIDRSALSEATAELRQFARKETFHQEDGRERRRDRRYSLITNVIAVPLDKQLRTIGQPFVALSSGMSVSGIRLIHTRPSPSDLLFLEFEFQPVKLLLTVLRSRPVGHCFEIAGQLMKADVANQNSGSPAFLTTNCNAIIGGDACAGNNVASPPDIGELVQWAGVAAAVQILDAELTGK